MDFAPVPPGTAPAAALVMRGPDPDLIFAVGDPFDVSLSAALYARPGVLANQKAAPYSRVAGALAGGLYTRDPAVLASCPTAFAIGPARLRAHWLRLTQDGLTHDSALSLKDFRAEREQVLAGLDHSNLDAAHLVVAADLVATEPPAGGVGGAGTLYTRSSTFQMLSCEVKDEPGLWRLVAVGDFIEFGAGLFLTGSRDRQGAPIRLLFEESLERAGAMSLPFATAAQTHPAGAAAAALQAFSATALPPRWALEGPPPAVGDLHAAMPAFSTRLALGAGASAAIASSPASARAPGRERPPATAGKLPFVDSRGRDVCMFCPTGGQHRCAPVKHEVRESLRMPKRVVTRRYQSVPIISHEKYSSQTEQIHTGGY